MVGKALDYRIFFLFQGSFATWKNASSGHRVGVYCGGS